MRALAQFESAEKADRLGGVLHHEGIENRIERGRDGLYTVWVIEESALDGAKNVLRAFEGAPDDPRFFSMAKAAADRRREEERQHKEAERKSRHSHIDFARRKPSFFDGAPITMGIIALCVVLYIVIWGFHRDDVRLALMFARNPELAFRLGLSVSDAVDGQWWRVVTPIFMHAPPGNGIGLLHIIFNMMWLKDLGPIIERVHGRPYLAVFVLVSAVVSNIAQYEAEGPNFFGMSGVVYGLFGFLWIRGKFNPRVPYRVPQGLAMWMMMWFVVCWLGVVGRVANMAHAGGLVVGVAWALATSGLLSRLQRK